MDYNIIRERHSVRSYTNVPLSSGEIMQLNEAIAAYNSAGGLHLQLVTDEPDAFGKSIMARYGKFENVRNYVCMIGPKGDDTEERIGYYGEAFVLLAQELGLNTCWVGMTFSKGMIPAEIGEGEKLYAVIAVGHGATQGSTHRIKSPEQICRDIEAAPEWFRRGIDCALLAPTAVNQQKFHFKWLGENRVSASTSWGFYTKIDLGIAKLHFELGSRPTVVEWV